MIEITTEYLVVRMAVASPMRVLFTSLLDRPHSARAHTVMLKLRGPKTGGLRLEA